MPCGAYHIPCSQNPDYGSRSRVVCESYRRMVLEWSSRWAPCRELSSQAIAIVLPITSARGSGRYQFLLLSTFHQPFGFPLGFLSWLCVIRALCFICFSDKCSGQTLSKLAIWGNKIPVLHTAGLSLSKRHRMHTGVTIPTPLQLKGGCKRYAQASLTCQNIVVAKQVHAPPTPKPQTKPQTNKSSRKSPSIFGRQG